MEVSRTMMVVTLCYITCKQAITGDMSKLVVQLMSRQIIPTSPTVLRNKPIFWVTSLCFHLNCFHNQASRMNGTGANAQICVVYGD